MKKPSSPSGSNRPPVRPSSRTQAGPSKPPKPAKVAKLPKASKSVKAPKSPSSGGGLNGLFGNNRNLRREVKHQNTVARVANRRAKASASLVSRLDDYRKAGRFKRYAIGSLLVSLVLLFALVLAAVYSPLLSVEKIVVTGNQRVSHQKLVAALKNQIGRPLPQVSSSDIGAQLKSFSLIESFSIVSQPPHTLLVRVVERTPIAIVYSAGQFSYFDPAGVRIGSVTRTDTLPVLDIKGTPATSETYKTAISVLLALPANMLGKIAVMTVKSTDNVTFRLRGYAGQKVVWGDKSNAILKSKVLAALIKNQSKNDRVTYDVSSPNAPTVRY